MKRACLGHGLIVAGLIVTFIGAATALLAALHVPGYWTPVIVGLGLLVAGVLRNARRGAGPEAPRER
jgi:hypothetical protein